MESTFVDAFGLTINNCDIVTYANSKDDESMQNQRFIALYIEKEDKWVLHPVGTNPFTEDLDLSEISAEELEICTEAKE